MVEWEEKRMYGEFVRDILDKTDINKMWSCFRKSELKAKT